MSNTRRLPRHGRAQGPQSAPPPLTFRRKQTMCTWNPDELNQIAETDEMYIAARRRDGTDRKPVIVWMVRLGDDVYTRSVNGPEAAWFRGTRARREGHISVGGLDKHVMFVDI